MLMCGVCERTEDAGRKVQRFESAQRVDAGIDDKLALDALIIQAVLDQHGGGGHGQGRWHGDE